MLLALFLDLKNKLLSLPFVHNLIKLQSLEKEKNFLKLLQCDTVKNISENAVGELGMGGRENY